MGIGSGFGTHLGLIVNLTRIDLRRFTKEHRGVEPWETKECN